MLLHILIPGLRMGAGTPVAVTQGADGGDVFGDYPAAVARARQRAKLQQRTAEAWPGELERDFVTLVALGLFD